MSTDVTTDPIGALRTTAALCPVPVGCARIYRVQQQQSRPELDVELHGGNGVHRVVFAAGVHDDDLNQGLILR